MRRTKTTSSWQGAMTTLTSGTWPDRWDSSDPQGSSDRWISSDPRGHRTDGTSSDPRGHRIQGTISDLRALPIYSPYFCIDYFTRGELLKASWRNSMLGKWDQLLNIVFQLWQQLLDQTLIQQVESSIKKSGSYLEAWNDIHYLASNTRSHFFSQCKTELM